MKTQLTTSLKGLNNNKIIKVSSEFGNCILIKTINGVKAFQSSCPHQGADLSEGEVINDTLICSMHQHKFSCKTGQGEHNKECLTEYKTKTVGNEVIIEFPSKENLVTQSFSQNIDTLPQPKGKFIVGNLPDFKSPAKHLVMENWVKEVGELFKISLAGKKFIVSADENINKQILKARPTTFRRFSKIDEIMTEMGISGVFNAEGKSWENHRKITAEALNHKNIKSFFPILSKMTDRLKSRWEEKEVLNEVIDIQQELMRYTVDITTCLSFGYDCKTLLNDEDPIQNHLEKIFPMINSRIAAPFPAWRFFQSKKDKDFKFALTEIKKTINEFIKEAKTRLKNSEAIEKTPNNFLEALLLEQSSSQRFSDNEIFGNVFTMLLAGEDTTSNSISWSLYYIATQPEIHTTIRKEADTVFSGDIAESNESLEQLKYTEAVALETLRLKPVTPSLYMEALEDNQVSNLVIKKGETVMMQNKVPQTDSKNFSSPDVFKPERWLEGCPAQQKHNTDVIRAFGAGPRFCPGKHLALQEMKIALSMICKNFDLKLAVKKEDVKELFAFTMFPENLLVTLKSRTNQENSFSKVEQQPFSV